MSCNSMGGILGLKDSKANVNVVDAFQQKNIALQLPYAKNFN